MPKSPGVEELKRSSQLLRMQFVAFALLGWRARLYTNLRLRVWEASQPPLICRSDAKTWISLLSAPDVGWTSRPRSGNGGSRVPHLVVKLSADVAPVSPTQCDSSSPRLLGANLNTDERERRKLRMRFAINLVLRFYGSRGKRVYGLLRENAAERRLKNHRNEVELLYL